MRKLLRVWITVNLALLASPAPAAPNFPPAARTAALAQMPKVVAMLTGDHTLLAELEVDAAQLAKARFDFGRAFRLSRLQAEKLLPADRVMDAVEKTNSYFVPLCVDGRCPAVARFEIDPETYVPTLVSAGERYLADRVLSTAAKVTGGGKGREPPKEIVRFDAYGLDFVVDPASSPGEEVLIPTSPREAGRLYAMLQGTTNIDERSHDTRRIERLKLEQLQVLGTRWEEAKVDRQAEEPDAISEEEYLEQESLKPPHNGVKHPSSTASRVLEYDNSRPEEVPMPQKTASPAPPEFEDSAQHQPASPTNHHAAVLALLGGAMLISPFALRRLKKS